MVVGTLNLTVRDVDPLSLLEVAVMAVTVTGFSASHFPPTVSALVPNSTRLPVVSF